jgi:hypothetical protein
MSLIKYKQTEYLSFWNWKKKNPIFRFILDIPYGLYLSMAPSKTSLIVISRDALNEVLTRGSAGGGQGSGLIWEPFEISIDQYEDVLLSWKDFDLYSIKIYKKKYFPNLSFIFDPEIMAITNHLDYLGASREKYK